jgi:hypothetical protein
LFIAIVSSPEEATSRDVGFGNMDRLLYKYLKEEIDFFFVDFKEKDINSNLFRSTLSFSFISR